MVFRHPSGIHHSCMRLLSRGVFQGKQQMMQWDAARAKWVLPRSVTSLPQFLSKLPDKIQESVLLLLNVAQRNTHLLCLPGRTYLIQTRTLWTSSKVSSSCFTATSEDTDIYMGRIAA